MYAWGIPLAITTSYVFLAVRQDLRLWIPGLIGASALAVSSLAVLLYAGEHGKVRFSAGMILVLGLLFRMLFLFRLPELSDDIYRYLWDGLQTLQGVNPYGLAPSSVQPLDAAEAALQHKVNHPQFVTIYPTMSRLIFALGAAVSGSVTGMKVILVILDMIACVVILKLLTHRNQPAWRAALYAWHPLPVIEIAGSGHVDGAGILFLLVTLGVLFPRSSPVSVAASCDHIEPFHRKRNSFIAGIFFAASVLVKFIPLVYLPVLLVAGAYPLVMISGFFSGTVLLCIPFLSDSSHMFGTLGAYLKNWEFANFAFRTLRLMMSSGDHARMILSFLFVICVLYLTVFPRINRTDCTKKESSSLPVKAMYGITFGFLLLTPALHPWYALYLVALFPFIAGPAGLVFSWAVFLSYHVLIEYTVLGRWIENDTIAAAVWHAPVAAWLASLIVKAVRPHEPVIRSL